MMRTCFIGDAVPPELEDAATAVRAAVGLACSMIKPGVVCKDVDAATRQLLTRDGWVNSLRTAYSIGIGFYTDWGEAERTRLA